MLSWITFALVLAVGGLLVYRKFDVRLPLFAGGFLLFTVAGEAPSFLARTIQEMSNPKTVVPICSAMGFAHVCKLTECDRHLVYLLTRPVVWFRVLMIPAGVAAGYLINTAIVSQSSAAAVLGPVLIPLLAAAGVTPVLSGSILLLGCSMGGELFNPGAVEQARLAELTGQAPAVTVARVMPHNLLASIVAAGAFWWFSRKLANPVLSSAASINSFPSDPPDQSGTSEATLHDDGNFHLNLIKALVPLIPLVLLMSFSHLVKLPAQYPKDYSGAVDILAAMLIGVVAALATAPKTAGGVPAAFFGGAGWAYTHVISLIVVATVFMESISANNLVSQLTGALAGKPALALLATMLLPLSLAALCGSGIAPAVAVMRVLIPEAEKLHLDPMQLGALIAVSAQFGRTMSPAAAVAILCGQLTGVSHLELVRRTAPPLLVGLACLYLAVLLGAL